MLSSRWHKVINDLWSNKTRTLLIVLSIAVGLFAVGTISSARSILETGMAESYAAIHPSGGVVRTLELFDEDFVQAIRSMPGVADADGRRVIEAHVQTGPNQSVNLTIYAVPDYDRMRVNIIRPEAGAWPPPDDEILIERAALPLLKAQIGDVVSLETAGKKQRRLRIAGTASDLAQVPAQLRNQPYGYVSFKTVEWFGEPYGFNELEIVAKNQSDKAHAQDVINQVKNRAERSGMTIPMSLTVAPGEVPMNDILQAILLLMGTIGLMSLFLSMFLIVNTVSALLTQQKRQIGVMKAVGATTGQIMGMYLAMVLIYGLLALAIACPLSIAGAQTLSLFMAAMFNFDLAGMSIIPPLSIALQAALGLLVPVLASLPPLVANLRVSAVEAMSTFRLGRGRFGLNLVDRLLSGANLWAARHILLRPILLSVRNIFRSEGRLALTLVTLTLAGAIFIAVFSVRATLDTMMGDLMYRYGFDGLLVFEHTQRAEKVEREAMAVPVVTGADVWLQLPTRRVRPDGSETKMIYFLATQPGSLLNRGPKIVQGRWLLPGDENAVVVDTIFTKEEIDVKLGDEIILKIEGRKRPFRVVGVGIGMMLPRAYANYDYVARLTDRVGQADALQFSAVRHDPAGAVESSSMVADHFEQIGVDINIVATLATEMASVQAVWDIIVSLLMTMALMLALVGGLGLMGTMSINVLERTREIGVLRAIGAPTQGVAWVFIREGIAIGVLSWLLSTVLSPPLGMLLSDGVGVSIIGTHLRFSYSFTGVWVWLALVVILSGVASFIPAHNAARLTVREVLAYE
jgi:putative ABC transport system permease protein